MMEFPLDPVGFAEAVGRMLEEMVPEARTKTEKRPVPLWARGWRWARRRGMGAARWQRVQRRKALEECLRRIREGLAAVEKPVLVYVVPFDVWKLRAGGGKRIAGIAKTLSEEFNVFVVMPIPAAEGCSLKEIARDCRLVGIPQSPEYEERCQALNGVRGAGIFAFADHFDLLPEFQSVLQLLGGTSRAWGFTSPAAWPVVQRYRQMDGPVFYDAHDDSSRFLQDSHTCADGDLVIRLMDLERDLLGQVSLAMFCTAEDLAAARGRTPTCAGLMMQIPNGVDMAACRPVFPSQARADRSRAGLDRTVAVFAGAHHHPNYEAVDRIVRELAPSFPKVVFVVMGMYVAAYRAFGGAEPGRNVVFTGPVPEETKEAIFALADLGLAPMKSGTGSSLKIPDYVAHGKVVVGTPVGLRGFETLTQFPSVVATEDVPSGLARIVDGLEQDPAAFDGSCRAAREHVKATLDWSVAAQPLVAVLKTQVAAVGR